MKVVKKRQVGLVDSQGYAATHTGSECFDWAGGLTGNENFEERCNLEEGWMDRPVYNYLVEKFGG